MVLRHRRRWRARLVVSIAIGFITMLSASMGLSWSRLDARIAPSHRGADIVANEHAPWAVSVYRNIFATHVYSHAFRSPEAAEVYRRENQIEPTRAPYWFSAAGHDPTQYPGIAEFMPYEYLYDIDDYAVGVPMRAFRFRLVHWRALDADTKRVVPGSRGGRLIGHSRTPMGGPIPTLPIWPGLILNTLFYAAIWFALFTAVGALRTARRLRRGLCPLCRYDLRGLPQRACPECGWASVPSPPRAVDA